MHYITIIVYASLQVVALFSTKYVLSELGFKYPMVFQGWQTLVGFFVFRFFGRVSKMKSLVTFTPIDRSGFISHLPNFILFTFFIISGSKALASIPILVFVCVLNTLPALVQIFDLLAPDPSYPQPVTGSRRRKLATLMVVVSGFLLCSTSPADVTGSEVSVTLSPYLALAVHVACGFALTLHSRIADARFSMIDRQLYSYTFSLIVLAPASLYLEEAFEALHFKHRRQVRFIAGSVVCAIAGALIHLMQSRLKEKESFGRLHQAGLALSGVISVLVFSTTLPWWAWSLCVINLSFSLLVPTHIKPEENLSTIDPGSRFVTGNVSTLEV